MKKFIHSHLKNPINPTEDSLRKHFENAEGITLYGLETKEKAEHLEKKFPKYVKVKATLCTSNTPFEEYGIFSKEQNHRNCRYVTYGISFHVSQVNGVTGEFNETGQKRIKKFIEVLKKEGYITA